MRRLLAALAALFLATGARADSYIPGGFVAPYALGVMQISVDNPTYGAKGDYQTFGDAVMTSGSAALTSYQATFTLADVGKSAWVFHGGSTTTIAAPPPPTNLTPGAGAALQNGSATLVSAAPWLTNVSTITVANCAPTNFQTPIANQVVIDINQTTGLQRIIGTLSSCTTGTLTLNANALFAGSSGDTLIVGDSVNVVCYPRGTGNPGQVFYRISYVGSGGETTASVESSTTCGANTVLEFTSASPTYGATGYNIYAGGTGAEKLQNDYPLRIGQTWIAPAAAMASDSWRPSPPGSNTTSINPPLYTTIAGFTDAHNVTLATTAGATLATASFTASVATNQLHVTAVASGTLCLGQGVSGAGVPVGTTITGLTASAAGLKCAQGGQTGFYTLSATVGTVGSESMTTGNENFGYASDDTAAFVAALTACGSGNSVAGVVSGGGRVMLGLHQYYIGSSILTIPSGCDLGSPYVLPSQQNVGGSGFFPSQVSFPAIVLNPAYYIDPTVGSTVDGVAIYQWGVPTALMSVRSGIDAVSNWWGTAMLPAAGDPGMTVHDATIVGFQFGILENGGQRPVFNHVWIDSTSCMYLQHLHDPGEITDTECWQFYISNANFTKQTYTISGAVNSAGAIQLTTSATPTLVQVGDLAEVESVGGFVGANGFWKVGAVSGSNITLANSQSAPVTACTWSSGVKVMTCTSMNSLSAGMTMTLSGNANTIGSVDLVTDTINLTTATTNAGSGVATTFSNAAYTSGGQINIGIFQRGGVGYYMADEQGTRITNSFEFGHSVGYQLDQVSTDDHLIDSVIATANCDEQQGMLADICILTTHQQTTTKLGDVQLSDISVTNGSGQPFVFDGGSANSATIITSLTVSGNKTTSMLGDVISGKTDFAGLDAGLNATFLNIVSTSETHCAGCGLGTAYVSVPAATNSPFWLSGDSSLLGITPGVRVLTLFNTAGAATWFKPAGLSYLDVLACGAGGAGGTGASLASGSASSGGAGGGGGGCTLPMPRFQASDLASSLSITVGAGGPAVTGVVGAAGSPGTQGGNSYFSTLACGTGGGGGQGGASAAASGGGGGGTGLAYYSTSSCQQGSTGAAGTGANSALVSEFATGILATQGNGGSGAAGKDAAITGAGGGGGGTGNGTLGTAGGSSLSACGGGGSGAGMNATPAVLVGGTAGTTWWIGTGANSGKGQAGGSAAGGASPTLGLAYIPASGASGGANAIAGNAFAGGTGLQCGGGGGGGSVEPAASTSGGGGKGGDGFVAVWMTF